MTAVRRTRLLLVVLAAAMLATLTVTPADARAPHVRAGAVRTRIGLDTRLLTRSGASAWAIDEYLAAHTSLPPLGASFMAAERKYGINARFLLAAALHESGWGSGYIARVKHNLFGYNAYDRDPVRYATAYRTYAANIDDTARFIKDFYLRPGGRWWGGRPTLRSMQRFWSSSGRWGTTSAGSRGRSGSTPSANAGSGSPRRSPAVPSIRARGCRSGSRGTVAGSRRSSGSSRNGCRSSLTPTSSPLRLGWPCPRPPGPWP